MAGGLNKCMFLGNLAADAELKMTSGGQAVLKFRIGCSESYAGKDGTRQEKTEWVSCTLWGKRAEGLSRYMTKGQRVFVEGSLRTASYEKDGEKRYRTEVNVFNVILCGGRGDGTPTNRQAATPKRDTSAKQAELEDAYSYGDEDEIPF